MDEYAFVINRLEGRSAREKLRLYRSLLGMADTALQPDLDGWEEAGADTACLSGLRADLQSKADWAAWKQGRYGVLGLWEEAYPQLLKEIYDPPFLLWYRGLPPQSDQRLCSVVGTRHPTGKGRICAWNFAASAAARGVGVVSGLAYGIDGAAHAGALDARGYTLAVLAGGIDLVIPGGHRNLAARILDAGGCLVSEFPPGVGVRKYMFPRRNRIISGLSPQLMVVEAPRESGALISVRISLEEGREVFVHTDCLDSVQAQGLRDMEALGAVPARTMDELLEA